MKNRFKPVLLIFIGHIFCEAAFTQGITTAAAYFKQISEYYSSIKDYEAEVDIKAGRNEMSGKASFKRPNLLRIDFSKPQNQVIVFNGDMLTVYLPESSAVLQQSVQSEGKKSGMSLASPQGLYLMSRYYSISYEIGQEPVPLEDNPDIKVVKLILYRRNAAEAFRYIKLAVNSETKLIQKVEAVTPRGEIFVFNFSGYKLNQNITAQRFIYDPPSSANNFNNFLFSE